MDSPKRRQLTRKELYDLVWAKPVSQVAKDWSLSDVGLAKLCRRHDVPLPYRGFWARKAAGQTPKPIPLPSLRDGIQETVWLDATPVDPPKQPDPEIEQAVAAEIPWAAHDRVPDDLEHCDALVAKAQSAIKQGKVDDYGRLVPKWDASCPLQISVSPALTDRALRIAQGVLQGAERRGYKIRVGDNSKVVQIVVRETAFEFLIEEPTKRIENKPDPKKSWLHPRFRYEPRGKLVLKIGRHRYATSNWTDSANRRIEDCLPDFFQSLAIKAIEQERADAAWKVQQDKWRAAEQLRAEYDNAGKQVVDLVKRLDNANGLRRLLTHFETEGIDMSQPVGKFKTWREWLTELIRLTDPVASIRSGELPLGGTKSHFPNGPDFSRPFYT